MCLPFKGTIFSFPNSGRPSAGGWEVCTTRQDELTISRPHLWLHIEGFSDHDWDMRIVFLHRRICPLQELPVSAVSRANNLSEGLTAYRAAALCSDV